MKKNRLAIIGIIIAVILAIFLIIRLTTKNSSNNSADEESSPQPGHSSIIEEDGNLEIEVPEGEDTFGE